MPYLRKSIKEKPINYNREDRQKIYQSAKWKALRLAKLAEQPLCERCLSNGKVTAAIDVHHKDSFLNYEGSQRLAKAYDSDNLMSVCKECHSYLHRNGTTHG